MDDPGPSEAGPRDSKDSQDRPPLARDGKSKRFQSELEANTSLEPQLSCRTNRNNIFIEKQNSNLSAREGNKRSIIWECPLPNGSSGSRTASSEGSFYDIVQEWSDIPGSGTEVRSRASRSSPAQAKSSMSSNTVPSPTSGPSGQNGTQFQASPPRSRDSKSCPGHFTGNQDFTLGHRDEFEFEYEFDSTREIAVKPRLSDGKVSHRSKSSDSVDTVDKSTSLEGEHVTVRRSSRLAFTSTRGSKSESNSSR